MPGLRKGPENGTTTRGARLACQAFGAISPRTQTTRHLEVSGTSSVLQISHVPPKSDPEHGPTDPSLSANFTLYSYYCYMAERTGPQGEKGEEDRGGEGREGGHEVTLKKSAASRPARTRFWGRRSDPGRHLVTLGKL